MNDERLRDRLRDAPVPDEREAEERSWRVVQAAYDRRQPLSRRRPRLRLALVPAAVALLALAVATSGTAIGDWLRDIAHPGRQHARPALSSLPGRGRLLVTSPSGPWVVKADGSKRSGPRSVGGSDAERSASAKACPLWRRLHDSGLATTERPWPGPLTLSQPLVVK